MLQRFCDMLALLLFGEDLKQSQSTFEFQTVVLSGVNFLRASFAPLGGSSEDSKVQDVKTIGFAHRYCLPEERY